MGMWLGVWAWLTILPEWGKWWENFSGCIFSRSDADTEVPSVGVTSAGGVVGAYLPTNMAMPSRRTATGVMGQAGLIRLTMERMIAVTTRMLNGVRFMSRVSVGMCGRAMG